MDNLNTKEEHYNEAEEDIIEKDQMDWLEKNYCFKCQKMLIKCPCPVIPEV